MMKTTNYDIMNLVQDISQSLANRRFLPLYPEQIHDLVKGGGLLLGIVMTREIQLTQGKFAIVDDEDYERVSFIKFYAQKGRKTWYAWSKTYGSLHSIIMGTLPGVMVDHADGNGLNCTRSNMRVSTRVQNGQNRGANNNNTSRYKGVRVSRDGWSASFYYDNKLYYLGEYFTREDAAIAFNHGAREIVGEFSYYNPVPGWENITPKKVQHRKYIRSNRAIENEDVSD